MRHSSSLDQGFRTSTDSGCPPRFDSIAGVTKKKNSRRTRHADGNRYPDLEVIAVDDRSRGTRPAASSTSLLPRIRGFAFIHIRQLTIPSWARNLNALHLTTSTVNGCSHDADVRCKPDARSAIALAKRATWKPHAHGDVEMVGFWRRAYYLFWHGV